MKRIGKLCSLVLALVLLLTVMPFPALAADLVNAKVTGTFCYGYARAQLDMVNDFRTGSEAWYWNSDDSTKTQYAAGELGTLVLDARLEQIAMERARELAVCYSHTRPNGESCFTLTVDGYQSYGENIAYGYTTPQSVFTAWREDNDAYSGQGHRRNMLRSGYTAVGFGCFYHQGIYYWAQEFSYYDGPAPGSKSDTEVTGYVPYSTSFLGEDYWSDEGNCPMSEYTPPSLTDGDWSYAVVSGKAMVTGYNGNSANITIPAKLGGYTVTKIADSAFYNEYYIDSVSFPSTLETIGDKAFYNSGLTGTVTIPASVKSIGTYAFSYTRYITEFSVSASNPNYCSYDGALYTKDKGTLLQYPLANERESYTVPEQTTLLYCTSFGNASHLKDLYVTGESVRAMTYTFYGDSFNVWCRPGTTLYSQISNGNLYGSVVLHDLSEASKPVITTQPASKTVTAGTAVTFKVAATGATSYQWYYRTSSSGSWTAVAASSGKTANYSLTAEARHNGYQYRCKVTNTAGSVYSNTVTLTVNGSKPVITTQPASKTVTAGTAVTFKVAATGATSYQWYYRTSSSGSWTAVAASSGKTAAYKLTAETRHNGYQYRCKVTNTAGSVYSNTVTLTVNGSKPVITTQPASKTVTAGTAVTFKVAATGATSYQWYYRTSSSGSWTVVAASSGKTAAYKLTAEARHNGYQYRCKVTNTAGSIYSNTVTLTVSGSGKPTITTQPKNITTTAGNTVTFKVAATGATSYQWYYRTSSTGSWTAVSAASGKTANYSLTTEARHNGYQYRCKLTNTAGSIYSNTVTLTVNSSKPVITTQPASKTVTAGTAVTFKVAATGATSYQWYYRTSSSGSWTAVAASSGKTAAYKLTAETRHNGYQYRCKLTNASGSVYTSTVTLTLGSEPEITSQPQNMTVLEGRNATFFVTATNATSYQWYYRTSSSGTWKAVSADCGKTSTYFLTTEARHNGYQYRCKVMNAAGYVYTNIVTLKVN